MEPQTLKVTVVTMAALECAAARGQELRKMPGRCGGTLKTQRVLIQQVGTLAGPKPKRAPVRDSKVPTVLPTVVLRLAAEKRYLLEEKWKAQKSKPAVSVRNWLKAVCVAETARKVHDLWGFAEESGKDGGNRW